MPVLCSDRQAPWLPLCAHAETAEAGQLSEDHVGRRVQYQDAFGVLEGVRRIDDHTTQLLLVRHRGPEGSSVITVPIGASVRITGRGTLPDKRAP